jgi:pilus assembly protein Flp/PilA
LRESCAIVLLWNRNTLFAERSDPKRAICVECLCKKLVSARPALTTALRPRAKPGLATPGTTSGLKGEFNMKLINKILKDEAGATAIEYGLIAALIAVAAITAMGALGNSLSNTFNYVSGQMTNAQSGKL